MKKLLKEDKEVWPEDHIFDTYRLEKAYKFTARILQTMLGFDGKTKTMVWDTDSHILTIYVDTPDNYYNVVEGGVVPSVTSTKLKPFGLSMEELREAVKEYKEKQDEVCED